MTKMLKRAWTELPRHQQDDSSPDLLRRRTDAQTTARKLLFCSNMANKASEQDQSMVSGYATTHLPVLRLQNGNFEGKSQYNHRLRRLLI